jgi:hypothetical protein
MKDLSNAQVSKLFAKLGSRGGKARAKALCAKQRKDIAHKAAKASAVARKRRKK